jgi:hypothetical protein
VKPHGNLLLAACAILFALLPACGDRPPAEVKVPVENLYDDTISTSYTLAMPDNRGEGIRITYTFFNMKRADTGNFKMTHVYLRHTGDEDTTIVNGTWKFNRTDSGNFVNVYSGRSVKRLYSIGEGIELSTFNTDSMIADTGVLLFRQKLDNDLRNSTVKLTGNVILWGDGGRAFIDITGDTIPVMKISAYPDLIALGDSIDIHNPGHRVNLVGTIQIRMSMDGRSTQKSLIVEQVIGAH